MSAESPRRGVHKGAQVISPQPIIDRSIIDSVAGIINEIVPQGYAGVSNSENKETISWARFEYADINDPALYPDYNEGSSTPPLLLVLGYATGVQVWLIAATGEATEVLSWRQGVVRTLRILPNPKTDDEHVDPFEAKRPMVAICDSAGPGPQFCHISFISLKTGEQVKSIKFKNPVCDVLANRRSVVVTFLEKIAVFDARTLEDVITITTCYASPGPNPNPVALGTRWLAYSEKKLIPARRSSGGCEGEGVQSYTATVLYAAKSLGKGLRGLGETVASSLTGNSVSPMAVNNMGNDVTQPGVVTILDLQAAKEEKELDDANIETVIAHFTAHSDAIVAMTFDLTGALLMTADKRGHDFHVFRIQPHPGGPTLAAVHHLYILHRGDTTAKVQDMVFSSDTRWAAVSTVRGTTHVFPVAPYGGPVGVRTHTTPHVVNRLSRFHKSAGLTDDGTRSHSPVSHAELPVPAYPYSNPRLPPYPHPTILHPLSQIRQPSTLNHVNSSSQTSRPQQRQRLHSDDSGTLPLKICVCFAPPRAWMYAQRESSSKIVKRAVDSLFIMACHGNMIQYDLEPKPTAGVPKEKVCDDTMIELEVEAKGQWPLLRTPNASEIAPPLPLSSPLLSVTFAPRNSQELDTAEDRWLSQVEIVTHAGPHRRLWMGPQFVFKTYNAPSGVAVNLVEAEAVEIGVTSGGSRPARSKPVNMPHAASRPLMPVVIDGSGSSYEQSPRFMEAYGDPLESENTAGSCESQLREDLAEAMLEISIASHRAPGRRSVFERVGQPVTKVVNPLGTVITVSADEEDFINSSGQELFDSAEEILAPPEAPRSVCAEEGPASLGDLEPPECGQTLRDLTEICAEMRSASEPAIDSVPDENISELKERRALCAEMMTTTGSGIGIGGARSSSSIDFEREEAFRDVPTSLSLCAEQGEIPNSPMTRAKETVWCCKRSSSGKREDHETCESNFAKAKYVVNYDDDSVTLMENRTTTATRGRNAVEEETPADVQQQREAVTRGTSRRSAKTSHFARKTVDLENADPSSRKGGASCSELAQKCSERFDAASWRKNKAKIGTATRDPCSQGKDGVTCGNKEIGYARWEPRVFGSRKSKSTMDEASVAKRFIDIASSEAGIRDDNNEDDNNDELPPLDPPPLDDFSSIEYHMVAEATCYPTSKDAAASSTQSDDDIEHIHIDSEVMQIRERKCTDAVGSRGQELSPVTQRKSSKSTISDDDLEYIHSSELGDALSERGKGNDAGSRAAGRRHSKHALSSDDDLEHVQHSEIRELERASLTARKSPTERRTTREATLAEQQGPKSSRSAKRRKDIMVIKSEIANTAAEVTVIYDPLLEVVRSSDTEAMHPTSPARRVMHRGSKISEISASSTLPGKRVTSQSSTEEDIIEIIDIDAMQMAEMDTMVDVPECKILPLRYEAIVAAAGATTAIGTRARKSRKSKKSQADGQSQPEGTMESSFCSSKVKMAELQEAVEDMLATDSKWQESTQIPLATPEMSWSSIVKKNVTVSPDPDVAFRPKETDLEPLMEVEERSPDNGEKDARKISGSSKPINARDSLLKSAERLTRKHQNVRRIASFKDRCEGNDDDIEVTTTKKNNLVVRSLVPPAPKTFNDREELRDNDNVCEIVAIHRVENRDDDEERSPDNGEHARKISGSTKPRNERDLLLKSTERLARKHQSVRLVASFKDRCEGNDDDVEVATTTKKNLLVRPFTPPAPRTFHHREGLRDDDDAREIVAIRRVEERVEEEERSPDSGGHAKRESSLKSNRDLLFKSAERATRKRQSARRIAPFKDRCEGNDDDDVGATKKNLLAHSIVPPTTRTFNDDGEGLRDDGDDDDDDEDDDNARKIVATRRVESRDDEEGNVGETTTMTTTSTTTATAATMTTEDSPRVSTEVVADQRRLVDDDGETRRGNAAVKGESQESSLQLVAARRRQERQVDGLLVSEERNINRRRGDTGARPTADSSSKEVSPESPVVYEKRSDSRERGEPLPEHSTSSSDEFNNVATFVAHGGGCLCCTLQNATERSNIGVGGGGGGGGGGTTSSTAVSTAASKKGSRSKRKKRR